MIERNFSFWRERSQNSERVLEFISFLENLGNFSLSLYIRSIGPAIERKFIVCEIFCTNSKQLLVSNFLFLPFLFS